MCLLGRNRAEDALQRAVLPEQAGAALLHAARIKNSRVLLGRAVFAVIHI